MKMPSLSTTAAKVMKVCNSPQASANDINRVISLDPVLTANVLKLINSAYYSLGDHVTSLTRAIVVLGVNTIKNLALSTAILGTISETKKTPSMDALWSHSILTGVTAKHIATLVQVPHTLREMYFVSGLLHDLGKIPLIQCFPKEYDKVIDASKRKNLTMNRSEKIIFGLNHTMVGRVIVKKWRLGSPVKDVILFHHHPEQADTEHQHIVRIVALANIFSTLIHRDFLNAIEPNSEFLKDLLTAVGVSWRSLAEEKDAILEEIDDAKVFLQITQK